MSIGMLKIFLGCPKLPLLSTPWDHFYSLNLTIDIINLHKYDQCNTFGYFLVFLRGFLGVSQGFPEIFLSKPKRVHQNINNCNRRPRVSLKTHPSYPQETHKIPTAVHKLCISYPQETQRLHTGYTSAPKQCISVHQVGARCSKVVRVCA